MHRLLQGAIPEIEIRADLIHIAEQDKLVSAVAEERLSMRNRAITVIPVASSGARIGRTNKPINA